MLPSISIIGKTIPMYGLCIIIGCFIAGFAAVLKCHRAEIDKERMLIVGGCGVIMGFLSAKLLFLLVSFTPKQLWLMIKYGCFYELLNSGLVFYGGLVGGIGGALLGGLIIKTRISDYENVIVPSIPLAHAFGRLGCLFAGCCYGKPVLNGPYIIYQNPFSDAPVGVRLAPVQAYEAIYNIIIYIVLSAVFYKKKDTKLILPLYMTLYGAGRFFLEYLRYDSLRGIYFGLSISQYISIGMLVAAGILFMVRFCKKIKTV